MAISTRPSAGAYCAASCCGSMDGGACGVAPPIASRLTTFIARARGEFGREYQWMPRMPCENNAPPLSMCQPFSSKRSIRAWSAWRTSRPKPASDRETLSRETSWRSSQVAPTAVICALIEEIRAGREGEPSLSTDVEWPDLDDSTDGWRELQGLSVAKTNMERAPVNCVDHRVGFTSGFIVAGLLR